MYISNYIFQKPIHKYFKQFSKYKVFCSLHRPPGKSNEYELVKVGIDFPY